MPKLTKRAVDAATPDPAGDRFLWDGEVNGFALRASRAGGKSYVLQYRTHEGRQPAPHHRQARIAMDL